MSIISNRQILAPKMMEIKKIAECLNETERAAIDGPIGTLESGGMTVSDQRSVRLVVFKDRI